MVEGEVKNGGGGSQEWWNLYANLSIDIDLYVFCYYYFLLFLFLLYFVIQFLISVNKNYYV